MGITEKETAKVLERFSKLKSGRTSWENHWQEAAENVLPRRSDIAQTYGPGAKHSSKIFDNTAGHWK